MLLWGLLALACIVIGFVTAIAGEWLMPPLAWFVAAIAFNTLGLESPWDKS